MWTECVHCHFKFQVDDRMFGNLVDCRKCHQAFNARWTLEPPPRMEIVESEKEEKNTSQPQKQEILRQEIFKEINKITDSINGILPVISSIYKNNPNESSTKLILDKIIQDVLGYSMMDIKTERDIQGRRADYVLSVEGKDVLIVEAKRMTLDLREKQIFQATSYGAHSGIRWALLTNVQVWQLYYIALSDDKINPELVLSIDLRDGLDRQEAQYFYMFSKQGMKRQKLLDNLREKVLLLRGDSITNAILSKTVIEKVRENLMSNYSGNISYEEVKVAMEHALLN